MIFLTIRFAPHGAQSFFYASFPFAVYPMQIGQK
jgi:hypothetical protein